MVYFFSLLKLHQTKYLKIKLRSLKANINFLVYFIRINLSEKKKLIWKKKKKKL